MSLVNFDSWRSTGVNEDIAPNLSPAQLGHDLRKGAMGIHQTDATHAMPLIQSLKDLPRPQQINALAHVVELMDLDDKEFSVLANKIKSKLRQHSFAAKEPVAATPLTGKDVFGQKTL